MFALLLLLVYLALKLFIDPRTGALERIGNSINATTNGTVSTLRSVVNGSS